MASTSETASQEAGRTLSFAVPGTETRVDINERNVVCTEIDPASGIQKLIYVVHSPVLEELPHTEVLSISEADRQTYSSKLEAYVINDFGLALRHGPSAPSKPLQIIIIISTGSGSQSAERIHTNLISPLLPPTPGQNHKTHTTTSRTSIPTLIKNTILPAALAGQKHLLVLLSGDGGIVDTVSALHAATITPQYESPVIAMIPCGTGNALAHSSGVARDGTFGLSALFRGKARALPTFEVILPRGSVAVDEHGQPEGGADDGGVELPGEVRTTGAVVFSWALHATLVAESDTPEYRKHGAKRFQIAAKELLFPDDGEMHTWRGSVEFLKPEEETWTKVPREGHAYVLVTLVSNLEERFCVSPESGPLDGKLWFVGFGPGGDGVGAGGGQRAMKLMEGAYKGGEHVQDENVQYVEVEALRLTVDEEDEKWRRVCVDGKIWLVPRGGTVEVKRDKRELVDLLLLD